MEDQFGGRTDDDLFADDFEPISEIQSISVPISALPPHTQPLEIGSAPPSVIATHTTTLVPTIKQCPQNLDTSVSSSGGSTSNNQQPQHNHVNHRSMMEPTPTSQPIHRSMLNSRHAPKDQVRKQKDQQKQHQSTRGRQKQHGKKNSRDNAINNNIVTAVSTTSGADESTSTSGVDLSITSAPISAAQKTNGIGSSSGGKVLPDPSTATTRLASGGTPRAKLTEAELSAKMERMRLLNQERERRHEAVARDEEAHAAALAKSLEEAAQRRRQRAKEEAERRRRADEERRKLEDEREKNRARKLRAMDLKEGGWDKGKDETMRDLEFGNLRRPFRGAHGGIKGGSNTKRGASGLAGSRFAATLSTLSLEEVGNSAQQRDEGWETKIIAEQENSTGQVSREYKLRGRGRGAGGPIGGRGRGGRSRRENSHYHHHHQNDDIPMSVSAITATLTADDFPALPGAPKPDDTTKPAIAKLEPFTALAQMSPVGKWDDEMEAMDAATAINVAASK